jgi:hypothetical protein
MKKGAATDPKKLHDLRTKELVANDLAKYRTVCAGAMPRRCSRKLGSG